MSVESVGDEAVLLDLYCCQGGASQGYVDAGWNVLGIDKEPQPHYPFPFLQADALEALRRLIRGEVLMFRARDGRLVGASLAGGPGIAKIVVAHASPPCQARTLAQKIRGNAHPNLIAPTRMLLKRAGLPFVIENVVPADRADDPDPLVDPILLCGAMFGIETYRHREFEIAFPSRVAAEAFVVPDHPEHVARTTKMGRPPQPGEYMHIVGNFSGVDRAREVMGMPWATRDGLREAIPPAYTQYIGAQMIAHVGQGAAE